MSLVWVRGPWCECPCGWVWMCVRAPWKGLFLRCCKYEYRFNKACTVNQTSSSREPVCHILIRLRLIQDEETLLEMIIGHWLAKHYIYHFSVTLRQFHLGGTLPLWDRSGKRWCITVHTFVLGLCCRWLCQQHWRKTVLRIATKSLHYELEKFYFKAYLGQILTSCWILGQGQVAPTQKSPKWGRERLVLAECDACRNHQDDGSRRVQHATLLSVLEHSLESGCHQILPGELMRWLKSW